MPAKPLFRVTGRRTTTGRNKIIDTTPTLTVDDDANRYCRRCGSELMPSIIASQQRACCLNATTIAGVCPTHGPLGPHHVVDSVDEADEADE